MEITKWRKDDYIEDAMMEVDLREWINNIFPRLDCFLSYLREKEPGHYPQYVDALKNEYEKLVGPDNIYLFKKLGFRRFLSLFRFPDLLFVYNRVSENKKSRCPALLKEPDLALIFLAACLKYFDLPRDSFLQKPVKRTFLVRNYLRSLLCPRFFWVKNLETIMERQAAINFFQEWVDHNTKTTLKFAKMEKIQNMIQCGADFPPPLKNSFIYTEFELDDSRVGSKIEKCRWHEILKELGDSDYAYAVACHYDFYAATCHNPNFILTRTKTLTKNHPYCDFLWHDTGTDSNLEHGDSKFWDTLY